MKTSHKSFIIVFILLFMALYVGYLKHPFKAKKIINDIRITQVDSVFVVTNLPHMTINDYYLDDKYQVCVNYMKDVPFHSGFKVDIFIKNHNGEVIATNVLNLMWQKDQDSLLAYLKKYDYLKKLR